MSSDNRSKSFKLGRDSKSGQFIPVSEARVRSSTATVEHILKPGRGDTGRSKHK